MFAQSSDSAASQPRSCVVLAISAPDRKGSDQAAPPLCAS
jgi:hypothetical protein